jgi:hypothetical protein
LSCRSPSVARSWSAINAELSASTEDGRSVVRLGPKGGNRPGSNIAMALVSGQRFTEGTIEIDLRGNGEEQASFVGIRLRGRRREAV